MRSKTFFLLFAIYYLPFAILGCGPTFPKERFKESIIKVCRDEYKVDVKVEVVGKTIAIYLPLQDLLDFSFAITESASGKINDVILSVSRVALSTDASYDFYCIIAHDVRIPEIQIVIIKSVDDVKRFLLNDISRGEYSKRMLVDIRLNPQSQKERAIKDVFEKMGVDKKWQDDVMNDFFRSQATALGDIGYWNGRFYIKDISLPEFVAEQIASRVKVEARDDQKLSEILLVKSSKGSYSQKDGKKYFRLEITATPQWFQAPEQDKMAQAVFRLALKVAGGVIHNYKFDDFSYVEVLNQGDSRTLVVEPADLESFRKKRLSFEEIMDKSIAGYN